MSNLKKNIFENINFNTLNEQVIEVLKNAVEKYWEQDVNIILRAVNDFRELREEILTKHIDFFSSQIKVENHNPVVIRLDKIFIDEFLGVTLNRKNQGFNLTNLTALEIKILNNFCEFLYKRISEILISPKDAKLSELSDKNINFLFMVALEKGQNSHIMISIPEDRVKLTEIKKAVSFKDEDFLTSQTTVKIRAGSSKITLDELKNLSNDDIVVLENSDSSKLTLISGNLEKKFNVKINPSLILNLDDEDENQDVSSNNEVTMEKNLWDDIQIEISAEFEKVKMTIGELKQITQGQIVDLGSVFDNEISLYVEDKKVAKGELIIINDKYAVKLNEVLSSNTVKASNTVQAQAKTTAAGAVPQKPQAHPAPKPQAQAPIRPQAQAQPRPQTAAHPAPKPQAQAQPRPKPQAQDEEFDYSDFEK